MTDNNWLWQTPDPRPLVLGPRNLGLFWSAKSGCTTVVLWFLNEAGLLNAARFYSGWPHDFRAQVLYKSVGYQRWLTECDPDALTWIRVIRDPYCRAVSSYRHTLRYGLAKWEHGEPFSFVDFLAFLAALDIQTCDLHFRLQRSPEEARVTLSRVINIDKTDLIAELNRFGHADQVAMTAEINRISPHHWAQRRKVAEDASSRAFSPPETTVEWPDYEAFFNAETRALVEHIYAKDFEAYAPHL